MKNNILFKLYFFCSVIIITICFSETFGQVEIDRESFSNTAGLTVNTNGTFGHTGVSGTLGNNDIFTSTSNATILGAVSGETGNIFAGIDIDNVDADNNSFTTNFSVGASDNGLISFSGSFAALGASIDAGDNVVVSYSVNGGAYTTALTFSQASGSTYTCAGVTCNSTFKIWSFDIGSGLQGSTITIRVQYNNLVSGDEGMACDEFILYHTCTPPTTQATNLSITNNPCTSMDLTWTGGNGSDVLVVAKTSASILTDPTPGTNYTANASFGSGDVIGVGNYVVYKGSSASSSVTVTNLTAGTTYDFAIYEFSGTCYNLTQLSGSMTLDCTAPTISTLDPADGSTGVCPNNIFTITFNENIQAGTSGNFIVYNSDGTVFESIPYNDSRVTYSGTKVLLNLNTTLVAGASYYVQISNTAVLDMSGNAFAGISNSTTWNFTVDNYNTYYVNDNSLTDDVFCSAVGTVGGTGTSANPFLTLNAALAVAGSCDVIKVDAGTYISEPGFPGDGNNIDITLNGLTIEGAGSDKTIFENGCNDCYFIWIKTDNVSLSGFKVLDYNDQTSGNGQALTLGTTGTPSLNSTLTDIQVDKTTATSSSADTPIVIHSGSSITFNGGGATCNQYVAGGGIRIAGATTNVTFNNYTFVGNDNSAPNGVAALWVEDGTVTINNCLFENNVADDENLFGVNGASLLVLGGNVTVNGSHFNSNQTSYAAGSPRGGSIGIAAGNLTISNSIIEGHDNSGTATSRGAGLSCVGGNVTLDCVEFLNNDGHTTHGSDVYVEVGLVTATECLFSSTASSVGRASGTFNISNSGNPSNNGATLINTTARSCTASPNPPTYSGSCATEVNLPLPIELKSFSGLCNNGIIELKWETFTENRNDFFTVERAGKDGTFHKIKEIQGFGSSSVEQSYQFEDINPFVGINYYRLSQTDYNGEHKNLKTIIVVNYCSNESMLQKTAFFQKTNNEVLVNGNFESESLYRLRVINSLGQTVATKIFYSDSLTNAVSIQLKQNLSNSVYFVIIENEQKYETIKVIIN